MQKSNSLKDISDAIVKGRTKICFDVGATFIDIVSGDSVLGDTVELTDDTSITINVKKLHRKHKLIVFDCEGECFSYTAKKDRGLFRYSAREKRRLYVRSHCF